MRVKRYHSTLREARKYIASLPANMHSLKIWRIKNKTSERYWVGSEFEWLNK